MKNNTIGFNPTLNSRKNSEGSLSSKEINNLYKLDFKAELRKTKLDLVKKEFYFPIDFRIPSNSDFVYNTLHVDNEGKARVLNIGENVLVKYIYNYLKLEEKYMNAIEYNMIYKALAKLVSLRNKFKTNITEEESFEAVHYKNFIKYRITKYETSKSNNNKIAA